MSVWDDITLQVDNLRKVVAAHSRDPHPELERAADLIRKSGRVIFTGVGSGLNATIPAACYLMTRGFPAQYVDTTEAVYGMLPGMKGAALVFNTRSGETAELVKLAKMARQEGLPVVAVTNDAASSVARLADCCLPTGSRWDDLVVISAYSGMLATELILAGQVLSQPELVLADLRGAAQASAEVLTQTADVRREMLSLFQRARPIYLLGRGPSLASALGGELVLEEMGRRPAVAMATGLFRQGPLEVVDKDFRAIMFAGVGEPARLNALLAQELIAMGAGLMWVGSTSLQGALNIPLPELPAHILPLLEIMPSQILAYDLAVMSGVEPGNVRYIQKVITGEEGIPANER